jgi:hypothetical protein
MKKVILSLTLMVLLMGTMVVSAGAETIEFGIEEWFATHESEVENFKIESPLYLTTIKGEFDIAEKLRISGSYTFGSGDDYKVIGTRLPATVDMSFLQIGVDYLVAQGIRVGGGYLTVSEELSFDDQYEESESHEVDISGLYLGASAELPLGDGFTLTGEFKFSPFMSAESLGVKEDVTMTTFDIGASYDLDALAINGGYRSKNFDSDDNDASENFSGFYLGATFRF